MNVKVRRSVASAESAAPVDDPSGARGAAHANICAAFNLHRRSAALVLTDHFVLDVSQQVEHTW